MPGWFKKKFGKKKEVSLSDSFANPEASYGERTLKGINAHCSVQELEELPQQEEGGASVQEAISSPAAAAGKIKPTAEYSAGEDDEARDSIGEEGGPQKGGFFQRLKAGLAKTRESLVSRIDVLFLGKKVIDPELLDELEEILITSDLGVTTTQELLEDARARLKRQELTDPQALKQILKEKILFYLEKQTPAVEHVLPDQGPFVIMVVGVNGVGKTTTIGKVAYKFVQSGRRVLLVAADTFRAAAIDQLKIWGERIKVEVVSQKPGADPSSVVYDALDYAQPRKYDVVIIDTAGRLHTKVNLMAELQKIKRVTGKKIDGAPHEVLLVLDATTGQNAISQAKLFHETVGVTALALTKLDGTAKGGVVINISHELQIPIRYIGIGEKMEDLRDFEPTDFVEALFDSSAASGTA
jgi:fused signal recognition particle receptor